MRTGRIQIDDVVEVQLKGRSIVGRITEVTEVTDGIVYFNPICPGAGLRHAKAREIVAHWRKAGRAGSRDQDEGETAGPTPGQLALPGAE